MFFPGPGIDKFVLEMAPTHEELIREFLTKPDPKLKPSIQWSHLRKRNNVWQSLNQLSTYEMVVKTVDTLLGVPAAHKYSSTLSDLYMSIDDIVKGNPDIYGTYADNNAVTPIMTDKQLDNFCYLVVQEWEKINRKRYNDL